MEGNYDGDVGVASIIHSVYYYRSQDIDVILQLLRLLLCYSGFYNTTHANNESDFLRSTSEI